MVSCFFRMLYLHYVFHYVFGFRQCGSTAAVGMPFFIFYLFQLFRILQCVYRHSGSRSAEAGVTTGILLRDVKYV